MPIVNQFLVLGLALNLGQPEHTGVARKQVFPRKLTVDRG